MEKTALFDLKEAGTITEIRRMILRVKGLPTCALGQPLSLGGSLRGMIIGFDHEFAEVLAFGDVSGLRSGNRVSSRPERLTLPVGENFVGRVVNSLCEPCDGRGAIAPNDFCEVFAEAPGITQRAILTRQLYTGTLILDTTIPIAKGQRELIIGDRMTGKTTLALDAILNQKDKNVICIYCCIGRNHDSLLKTVRLLEERQAMPYTIVVSGTADAPAGHQYLAPYTAATLGEYFMRRGRDVLVVFDDITKHAWVYRQISLLMERSPGREAYPGDIFSIHSQLVERAAQLSPEQGGGSMTFLPIVETQQGDLTSYVSSNLISMTDGQIYLSSDLFKEGVKPALDVGLSVSRIGNKIHCPAMKVLSASLRLEYVKYRELLNLTKLRSNVSKAAHAKLVRGRTLHEILKQNKNHPMELGQQLVMLSALRSGVLDDMPLPMIVDFRDTFYRYLTHYQMDLLKVICTGNVFSDATKTKLEGLMNEHLKTRMQVVRDE